MEKINDYDIEAELLNNIADNNSISVAEVVSMLCDYIEDMLHDNGLE